MEQRFLVARRGMVERDDGPRRRRRRGLRIDDGSGRNGPDGRCGGELDQSFHISPLVLVSYRTCRLPRAPEPRSRHGRACPPNSSKSTRGPGASRAEFFALGKFTKSMVCALFAEKRRGGSERGLQVRDGGADAEADQDEVAGGLIAMKEQEHRCRTAFTCASGSPGRLLPSGGQ